MSEWKVASERERLQEAEDLKYLGSIIYENVELIKEKLSVGLQVV